MAPTLYKKYDYTYFTREIPLSVFKTLKTVNKKTGLTVEEELLEYCRSPRSIVDLKAFLGINNKRSIQARFTKPLMQQGRLKFIYPESPKSVWQRYLNAEVNITPEMQEAMVQLAKTERHLEMEQRTLEFCKVPRSLGEIKDYVGLAGYDIVRKRAVQPLIDQGKIKMLYPHNPLYKLQKFVVTESCAGYLPFTEDTILTYCETPRTKEEIKNYFAIGQDLLYKVLNPIIAQGKLIYTKSTRVGDKIIHKKLVKSEFPQAENVEKKTIPTDAEIIEFCTTPRCHYEIKKAFAINDYTCRKIVNRLICECKLVYTEEVKSYQRKLLKNDPILIEELNGKKLKDEEIIAYCKVPRLIQDIKNYFGITDYKCKKSLDKLIAEGKLVFTEKTRSWYRKIVSKDVIEDSVVEDKPLTDEDILLFCSVPRYVYEIKKEFHLNNSSFKKVVERLLIDGKLIDTEKDKGYYRKLIKNG